MADADDDVVPMSLIPVAVGRKRAPLALTSEDLVLDAFFRHGQVELLGAATARSEDRAVLSGAAHAVAGEDRAGGQLREFGDVVIRQVCGGELNERGGGGGDCEDLFRGEDGVVRCEGTDLDASSRGELESSLGATSGGRKVCAG